MVEKFNFYDIYGYLLPGLVFIGLAWLPFGLLFGIWPKAEISSAILVLLAGYILGHILQSFGSKLIPSTLRDRFGNKRYPSDLVLDPTDYTFTVMSKKRIAELSDKYFQIDLALDEDLGNWEAAKKKLEEEIARETDDAKKVANQKTLKAVKIFLNATRNRRNDAFNLARSTLLRDKKPSYWEQFEGLYALMRGATVALGAATVLFLGWASSFFDKQLHWSYRETVLLVLLFSISVISFFADQLHAEAEKSNKMAEDFAKLPAEHAKPADINAGNPQQDKQEKQRLENERQTQEDLAKKLEKRREAVAEWKDHRLPFILGGLLVFALLFGGFWLGSGITIGSPPSKPVCGYGLFLVSTCSSSGESSETQTAHIRIERPGFVLLCLALLSGIAMSRSYGAYKAFAREFAVNVWRDFATIDSPKPDELHM